ncbi:hypothetical protein SLS59_000676 [Nothophoma quercina]|uniref:glutathione transferase n=1 Tax=Nothophoma quercina TaxID=749835 RepID=A0ABR3S406_9PLEO
MATTVFGASYSTRTQRVLLVLEELELEYESKTIDLMKGEHHVRTISSYAMLGLPWFPVSDFVETHHPLANIPAIEVDGVKLLEPRAIGRFLVSKYLGPRSLSSEPTALGTFEQAASVEYAYFEPAVSQLGWEEVFKKAITGQDADANALAHHKSQLLQVLDYYEQVLFKHDWLAGKDYTLVDAFHIPWFGFLMTKLGYQSELESRKNVAAW